MAKLGSWHFIAVLGASIAGVILLAAASGVPLQGGRSEIAEPAALPSSADYLPPVMVGKIETPEITESSGLSASECQDVLWTHNDAGNAPLIFAMDTTGKHLGTWKVLGAESVDWESIATHRDESGKCSLLIADFGDNDEARRSVEIYRIPEPSISADGASSSAQEVFA